MSYDPKNPLPEPREPSPSWIVLNVRHRQGDRWGDAALEVAFYLDPERWDAIEEYSEEYVFLRYLGREYLAVGTNVEILAGCLNAIIREASSA